MQRTNPPFRADHVGSLLRSAALKDARAKRESGSITAGQLKAVEDREIAALIGKQEAVGLKASNPELHVTWNASAGAVGSIMSDINLKNPKWQDERIRQAMNLGLSGWRRFSDSKPLDAGG